MLCTFNSFGFYKVLLHAEGYVKPNGTNSYLYVYQYKDHLGNVRLSYADCDGNGTINPATEILEENNYYPFGLQHQGYNDIANSCRNEEAEAYKLNGKEYEDSFGLNIYEMDLRQLDPAIGRWTVMDPVVHHDYSPYSAFDNNPVYWSDPSGADSHRQLTRMFSAQGDQAVQYLFDLIIAAGDLDDGADQKAQMYGFDSYEDYVNKVGKTDTNPADENGDASKQDGKGGPGKNKGANNKGIGSTSILGIKMPTFFGAPVNVIPGDFTEASFFKGMINISQSSWNRYKTLGLDSSTGRLLMHEYGHFLQKLMGGPIQYDYVAISSLIDFLQTDYEGHQKHWSEIQASTLAAYYFDFNKGFLKENLIDDRYVNELILQNLKGGYLQHPNYKP